MAILNSLGKAVKNGASGLFNDLTGAQINCFFKDSEQSAFDFGQRSNYFLDGQPRLKFQYFVKIKFNPNAVSPDGESFVKKFLNDDEIAMLVPLVRSVDLPSMKIDTDRMNQYNQWKVSQTKIDFDPITMVMHDVVDGKTLRLWEMYYEYYFKESMDYSGTNIEHDDDTYLENKLIDPDKKGPVEEKGFFDKVKTAFVGTGDKADKSNAVIYNSSYTRKLEYKTGNLNNGYGSDPYSIYLDSDYGYNTTHVGRQKDLIDYIEIYQYHAGRWSKVHLVRPRISAFKHDTLAYEETGDTGSMTFTMEYEYALYHNFYSFFLGKFTQGVEGNENPDDFTGATDYFKYSNSLHVDHPPNVEDYHVRRRTLGKTPELKETIGTLPNESLLGNLVSDVSNLLTSAPDKIGDAVAKGVTSGEWESPFDGGDIAKSFKNKAKSGVKTIGAKNLKSTASDAVGSFVDFRRT